ncbi:MAG: hypothetical protein ACPGYY_06325 [Bacteroidia bacterium]
MSANIKPKNRIVLHKVFILIFVSLLASCKDNPHIKDLSNIDLELSTIRFEQDLFACKSVDDILQLNEEHPDFYSVFTGNLIAANVQRPGSNDTDVAVELYRYISHRDMDSLYKITQTAFPDFTDYTAQITQASKYIKHYFPDEEISGITTFISTFQYGSIFKQSDKSFGVGLDMYLGSDFEVYGMLNPESFPTYRVKKFEDHRIVPNCIQTFVDYKIPAYKSTSFIDQAVQEGKKLYLLDLLLPEFHDSLKINYLNGQIEWAESQEKNMWSYLIQEDVLFSSDKNEYQKHYFNEGPFTSPFGNDSSPRAGAWLGWQIVRKYMSENTEVSLNDLLSNKNHQDIFQKSGYRP